MSIIKYYFFILGLYAAALPVFGQQRSDRNISDAPASEKRKCLKVDSQVQVCPDERITYVLYNRRLGKEGFNISTPLRSMPIRFRPKDKLKVIVHGLIIEYMTPELYDIKNDYIKKLDCHVLIIHYEEFTDFNCYAEALENIKHVGKCIGQLLYEFIVHIGLTDIHVITYSLGGHVANYIAQAMTPYMLARITALDPPTLFVDDEFRLDPTDAAFIDTYHTSPLSVGQSRGHARFLFNGGLLQPGCYLGMCSHSRAVEYFKESILSRQGFYGTPCDSYFSYLVGNCGGDQVIAGADCPATAKGLFFIKTNKKSPFAQGREKLKLTKALIRRALLRRRKN